MLDRWLTGKHVLGSNSDVARTWDASLRGRLRPANDSWIAACRLAYGAPLATRNVKDYEDFVEHESYTGTVTAGP
jgi:toxin FitB